MPETTIRKGEFARQVGVSAARVSQWVAAGMPVEAGGRLNLQRALAWVTENVDRSGGGWPARKATPPETQPASVPAASPQSSLPADPGRVLLVARAKKLLAEAKRAERVEKQQAGELLPTDEVESSAFSAYRQVRDGCQSIPARCAAAIVAQVRSALEAGGLTEDQIAGVAAKLSPMEFESLLASEVRKLLSDLADAIGDEGQGNSE